jgi:hypothetical protein
MIDLSISEDNIKKIELFFSEVPGAIQKIIKKSLVQTASEVRKTQKKEVKKKYSIDTKQLNTKNIFIKKKPGEISLLASKKARNIEDYYISLRKPSKTKQYIKGAVFKGSGKDIKNMFWAFYKNKTESIGLYKRDENNKIKKVKSPSIFSLVSSVPTDEIESKIQEIFENNLEKIIEEEMGKL